MDKPREPGNVPSFYRKVWNVVLKIPHGKVVSYGQVATWLGSPRAARAVGYAMFNTPEGEGIPWHRVVNAKGEISEGGAPHRAPLQKQLLLQEGVEFSGADTRIDMRKFRFEGVPLFLASPGSP